MNQCQADAGEISISTFTVRYRGFSFELQRREDPPSTAWVLTFCGHEVAWLPEQPDDTAVTLTNRCKAWLKVHFRLLGVDGERYQMFRQYSDLLRATTLPLPIPILWVVVQEEIMLVQLPAEDMGYPVDPEPTLRRWLRRNPLRCVGGPWSGQRTSDQGDEFRPTIQGKVQTRDGPLDAMVPAAGEYFRDGQEYRWRPDAKSYSSA